jgi:hypothetical protein
MHCYGLVCTIRSFICKDSAWDGDDDDGRIPEEVVIAFVPDTPF